MTALDQHRHSQSPDVERAQLLTVGELGDEPRRLRRISPLDTFQAAAALIGATVLAWTVCQFLQWDGLLPVTLLSLIGFLVVYSVVVREQLGKEAATDRIVTVLVGLGGALSAVPLVFMVGYLVVKGAKEFKPSFFTDDLSRSGPLDPGGGAYHAIIGTLEQVGLASLIVVPLGVLTAVYLNELKGRLATVVRFLVDAMSGVPSVIAGLLIYAVWVIGLNQGFSGFAAALALLILMLPTVTRTCEEVLRTIPDGLREASLALGAPQWRTVLRVVLPTARTGIVTAVLLSIARGVGETAPMFFTARGQQSTNYNVFENQQSDLPLFIFQLLKQPGERQIDRAHTGALVLLLLVLAIFTLARRIGRPRKKRKAR